MNPVERAVRRIDAAQQRHRVPAFVFGVIKKYGDDNGGVLASNLAQSAFVTVFPLLLILVTVLGSDGNSDSVYGLFATVLVLLAWIYLGAQIAVYAAEVNVVLTRRLWPRTMVQPPLAEADRASLAVQALQNQRREEQNVEVTFSDRPLGAPAPARTPRTPQEIAPPARAGDHKDNASEAPARARTEGNGRANRASPTGRAGRMAG